MVMRLVIEVKNKIVQLLMEKDELSLNNDILPLVFEEFRNTPLNRQTCVMINDFISQQLYGVCAAGIDLVCIPQFTVNLQKGIVSMDDIVYKVVK